MIFVNTEDMTLGDLRRGYSGEAGRFTCLVCGQGYNEGEVYPIEGRYFEGERAAAMHRALAHPDYLERLIASPSKYNTLTENQRGLLLLFAEGRDDRDIAAACGLSASTVRHQRFTLREKAKQARHYLAVWEGVFGGAEESLVPIASNAPAMDERYVVTKPEREAVLKTAFTSLEPLRLAHFPRKEKKKIVVLAQVAGQFEVGREYTEKEVNALLKGVWEDYATLRRYLIEYAFFARTRDGSRYWLTDGGPFSGQG